MCKPEYICTKASINKSNIDACLYSKCTCDNAYEHDLNVGKSKKPSTVEKSNTCHHSILAV